MAHSADPDQLASSGANLKKPTDLDLHCLQRQGISGFSRTRVNIALDKELFSTQLLFLHKNICW